jgi:hypothetical protein
MLAVPSVPFFQGKATTISILTEINCIFCVTKGFQPSAVYREQALKQLDFLETKTLIINYLKILIYSYVSLRLIGNFLISALFASLCF